LTRAIEIVKVVVEKLPSVDAALWRKWIGSTYMGMGRYRDAIEAFREVRNLKNASVELKTEEV